MNVVAVRTLTEEAHRCAMWMLDSGTYIKRELPNVHMDEATREFATKLCSQLVGTWFDITTELRELDQLLREGATDEQIASAADLIIRWLGEDIQQLHQLVTRLEAAVDTGPDGRGAYILVAESAANILNPFNRAKAAADSLTRSDSTGSG